MTPLRKIIRTFNEETRSFAELLPWFGPATDQLVLNLDGSLLAAFEYTGVDVESSSDAQLEAALNSMQIALQAFDDHNTVWTFLDKRRKKFLGDSTATNEVTRYVDQAWRDSVDDGSLASVRHVMFVAYQPFGGEGGFFDEVASQSAAEQEPFLKTIVTVGLQRLRRKQQIERMEGKLHGSVEAFEKQLASFLGTLGAHVRIRRMKYDKLVAELSNRANLASPRSRVALPPNGHYFLNTLLPTDGVFRERGGMFRFEGTGGSRFVSMHAVKGYPGKAVNDPIEGLMQVPVDFSLVQMFRFVDNEKAKKFIADQEGHYRSSIKSPLVQAMEKFSGVESERVNLGMAALANDAQSALIEATAHNVGFGYHAMALQVISDDIASNEKAAQLLQGVMTNAGYGLVRENVNAVSALSLGFPGSADAVLRQTFTSTSNMADITVLRTLSSGPRWNKHLTEQRGTPTESLALLPTRTDVPEFFNFHVGDVGHFFIVGPAGAGKTTFINFLITLWQRTQPCRTIVLDKGLSNYITVKSLGGQHIDLRRGEQSCAKMSPMRWAHRPEDFPKLQRWLELALQAFDPTPLSATDIQILDRAIALASQQEGEKSLSGLHALVKGQDKVLAQRLAAWTKGQRYGDLFDNSEDTFALSDICAIELGTLLSDEHLAPPVLGYLFEIIEESVDSTKPTFIYLEEAWYLLSNPTFRARFEDYIKTMRKRNAFVGIATQSLADIRKSPISSTLNDNIKTRIFLPNMQAFDSIDVYRDMLGLSHAEVEVIRSARQKREYFIVQDDRRRLVDVNLPPDILSLTRSDPKAKTIFERHMDSGHRDWLSNYMQEVIHA